MGGDLKEEINTLLTPKTYIYLIIIISNTYFYDYIGYIALQFCTISVIMSMIISKLWFGSKIRSPSRLRISEYPSCSEYWWRGVIVMCKLDFYVLSDAEYLILLWEIWRCAHFYHGKVWHSISDSKVGKNLKIFSWLSLNCARKDNFLCCIFDEMF